MSILKGETAYPFFFTPFFGKIRRRLLPRQPGGIKAMKPTTKTWLSRLAGILIFLQTLWAIWFFTRLLLASAESWGALFISPGVYLVEITFLAGFAAVLPWLKLKQTPVLLWAIAGVYAALVFTDFWSFGYYLSPSFILALVSAAWFTPNNDQFTWRNFFIFSGAGLVQFFLNLAPFIKRMIF
jgi:hypothetical protein